MSKKSIKYIIPQTHNLDDCWFIQWLGKEYYISKKVIKEKTSKLFNKYVLINFLLMMLIWIISGLIPFKNAEDILRMLLLAFVTGIQSGVAITEDREIRR